MAASQRTRPSVVLFDVVETLFSLEPVGRRMEAAGLTKLALDWWFSRMLRDAFALSAAGGFVPFSDLGRHALAHVLEASSIEVTEDRLDGVLEGMNDLEPHPDVGPALETATRAGVAVMALTNSSARATETLLERAGLHRRLAEVVSVEEVRRYKPRPEPYLHAVGCAGVRPPDAALVAVHGWDVHGAAEAGLTAAWARRLEGSLAPGLRRPHVVGEDLVEVVQGLLGLPPS